MPALAYLALPVTGLLVYFAAPDARARFHGLQAITIGLLWPLALYAAALGPVIAVQIVFVIGLLLWLGFLAATVMRRDPRLPWLGRYLEVWSARSPRGEP